MLRRNEKYICGDSLPSRIERVLTGSGFALNISQRTGKYDCSRMADREGNAVNPHAFRHTSLEKLCKHFMRRDMRGELISWDERYNNGIRRDVQYFIKLGKQTGETV